jgi:uncharacterized membrane protein YkgB
MIDRLRVALTKEKEPAMEPGPTGVGLPWHLLRDVGVALESTATVVLRYGLVVVVGWIGAMKFTTYEATGIEPFIANSPLMAWFYQLLSVQGASNLLGVVELAIAALLALRPLSPRAALVGGALAAVMFLTTLTFIFSTPGWEPTLGGFPALSAVPGQFLLKDVVLLGAALFPQRSAPSR